MPNNGTPWAPSQYKPVYCCCPHSDAWMCTRWRTPGHKWDKDTDEEPCDCCCHHRELDEEEDVW